MFGGPLQSDGRIQISPHWSGQMNLFTIIGIVVVVLFVAGYFGLS
jgi:hypothetical protein